MHIRAIALIATAAFSFPKTPASASEQRPALIVRYASGGLASVTYDGNELLASNIPPDGALTRSDGTNVGLTLPAGSARLENGVLTRTYPGLVIVTTLRQDKDDLVMTVTYQNKGIQSISAIEDKPFALRFPRRPLGITWKWDYSTSVDLDEAPGVVIADWGVDKLALVVNQGSATADAANTVHPMSMGFGSPSGEIPRAYPITFRTTFHPPLEPGHEWTFQASLRFAPSNKPTMEFVGDVYRNFAAAYPFTLNWPDRRPIGTVFLAQSAMHWPTNPRGWFADEKVDVTTPKGRKAFHDRLMKYADTCIYEIKKCSGQGMICWDVEGDQMPHAITYLGDPRILPKEAPEMDAAADEFFKKFRDAGLKTGVCIRPSQVFSDGAGGWKHRQVRDCIAEMSDKIAYAKRRWGCSIFYMDTNVRWPYHERNNDTTNGMWQGDATILSSRDMVRLCKLQPNVLIFTEFARFGYYGVCSHFSEGGSTSDEIHATYPRAFTVTKMTDYRDYLNNWDSLREGLTQGDIHLFPSWYGDLLNAYVYRMRQDADFLLRTESMRTPGPFMEELRNRDPLVRYAAVSRATKPDAEQTALLVKALNRESEWVVRRQIVQALGRSGNAAAIPALTSLLRDDRNGLSVFAISALGNIGAPATPALLALALGRDQGLALGGLEALAHSNDPAATSALILLTENSDPKIRALAVRALGSRPSQKVADRLTGMLEDGREPSPVMCEACKSLGGINDRAAVKPLVDLIVRAVRVLHDNQIRAAAGDALEALTGLQYGYDETRWQTAMDDGKI
jgi:HEAT repeat protein